MYGRRVVAVVAGVVVQRDVARAASLIGHSRGRGRHRSVAAMCAS